MNHRGQYWRKIRKQHDCHLLEHWYPWMPTPQINSLQNRQFSTREKCWGWKLCPFCVSVWKNKKQKILLKTWISPYSWDWISKVTCSVWINWCSVNIHTLFLCMRIFFLSFATKLWTLSIEECFLSTMELCLRNVAKAHPIAWLVSGLLSSSSCLKSNA